MRWMLFSCIITLFSFLWISVSMASPAKDKLFLQKEEFVAYSLTGWEDGFVDWIKLQQLLEELENETYQAPKNATLGKNRNIIADSPGYILDRKSFTTSFLIAYYEGKDSTIEIPKKMVHARLNGQMLEEIMQKKLGAYTTYYNPTNEERATNIALSAEAIHGAVVFPGEIFSFNETVGERTEDKGYKRAPVIVQGEFAEDIGGGICQVSSTLFNAVDLHGIEMVERFTHSRSVPYVPPGRDATVSWWGPDFSFKNLYNEPIVLVAQAENGILTIEIFSSETVEHFRTEQ